MRSAALVTVALAMLSFSVTGCHSLQTCSTGACATADCGSCGGLGCQTCGIGGAHACSTCGQDPCGCGGKGIFNRGLLGGHLGHGHLLGHRRAHGASQAACACPRCGLRGLVGSHCKGCGLGLFGGGQGVTPHTSPYAGPYGPQGGAVAYPYYTTRAPRDFLLNNPPSLGY